MKGRGIESTLGYQDTKRTTILLTTSLYWYLDFPALDTQRPKGEIVREAITTYLSKEQNYAVEKIPDAIVMQYPDGTSIKLPVSIS